jgi:hypothetical protein
MEIGVKRWSFAVLLTARNDIPLSRGYSGLACSSFWPAARPERLPSELDVSKRLQA